MSRKTKIHQILFWYSLIFIILNLILGFSFSAWKNNINTLIVYVLILTYFILGRSRPGKILKIILPPFNFFCYCTVIIIWLMNLITAISVTQIIFSLTFTPLVFFFGLELTGNFKVFFNRLSEMKFKETKRVKNEKSLSKPQEISPINISDQNRREFLKMVGSTGLGIVALSLLNPKKAGAAFFGSVPGPGTVAIKDADGNKIDPAAKQPTDGYKISKLDDTTSDTYAYYGFVDQNGQWYIQRETLSGINVGTFQYYRGSSDFSGNWDSRDGFTYRDFDLIF